MSSIEALEIHPRRRRPRRLVAGPALAAALAAAAAGLAGAQTPPPPTPSPAGPAAVPGPSPAASALPLGVAVAPAAGQPLADLLPNEAFVYGYPFLQFDTEAFVAKAGGYLARYHETVGGEVLSGAQIVQRVADDYSLSPPLLLALIQMSSRWVTDPEPGERSFPAGEPLPGLHAGLAAAADGLSRLYYGHRFAGQRSFPVADGRQLRLEGTNAATFAVVGHVSRQVPLASWAGLQEPSRYQLAFARLFGDPFALVAANPAPAAPQLTLGLPFPAGEMWYYVLGPHSPAGVGGARAAVDFSPPPAAASGCFASPGRVAAVAEGKVLRAGPDGVVVEAAARGYPLDGYQGTGWAHVYRHLGPVERVAPGTAVKAGDSLGHPGCEGSALPLTRLSFSRTFNGEWVPADDRLSPLVLGGWTALPGPEPGSGWLVAPGLPPRTAGLQKADATNGVVALPASP